MFGETWGRRRNMFGDRDIHKIGQGENIEGQIKVGLKMKRRNNLSLFCKTLKSFMIVLTTSFLLGGAFCEDLAEDDSSNAYSSSSSGGSSDSWNSLSIVPVSKNRVYQRALGKSSIFTCTANVEFPERLNDFRWWWPDGRAIEATDSSEGFYDETRVEIMKDQPGSLTLLFPAIQEQDLGTYRCTATYMLEENAQQLKTDFTLRAYVPITFEDAPHDQYAVKGKDFLVRCRVRADPEPHVDWKKDHRVINDSDHFFITKDGVIIRSVTQDDEGVYTCRVRVTSMGTVEERHIQIQVHEHPILTSKSEAMSGVEGETVTLRCSAYGKPPPEYEWSNEKKENFLRNPRERFKVDKYNGTLMITDLKKEDQSIYTCVARNAAGSVTVQSALAVVTKPKILEFKNVTGQQSGNSVLICRASGDPAPEIRFKKDGNREPFRVGPQTDNKRIFYDQLKDPETGITIGTLRISDVSRSDDGLYQCYGYNERAQSIREGHFTVQFPPSFLNTPMKEAWSWDQRPVNMTCVAEAIPNATITWFILRSSDEQVAVDQYTPNVKQFGYLSRSILEVNPVSDKMYGGYKCLAINKLGTAEHRLSLQEARKPGPMLEAIVHEKTAHSLAYKLVGPVEDGGLPVKKFLAQLRKIEDSWEKNRLQNWTVDRQIFVIDELEPTTTYHVRFAAENDVGLGPWALEKAQQTPRRSAPETPTILNQLVGEWAITAYPDRFQLIWRLPPENGEPLEGFEISYEPVRNISVKRAGISVPDLDWEGIGKKEKVEKVYPSQPRHMLRNLTPDTFYRAQLKAVNQVGASAPDEIIFKTANIPGEAWRPLRSPVTSAGSTLKCQSILQSQPTILLLLPLIHINFVLSSYSSISISATRHLSS